MLAVSGDVGNPGGDAKTYGFEPTQLFHHVIDFPSVRPLWVEDGFCVIEEQDYLPRG